MSFPANVDFDKIITIALAEITHALNGWSSGFPRDEVALMNRVTERLNRRRRGCDVGINEPVVMYPQLATLHRRGSKQTDKYGSDLAITVWIPGSDFLKTALFQFKKSTDFQVEFERIQLLDSQKHELVAPRSFAAIADETRTGIRLRTIEDILHDFDHTQKFKTFDSSTWTFLTQWLWEWFSCTIGPVSERTRRRSVERLLQQYVVRVDDTWIAPWGISQTDTPDGPLPARAWLNMFLAGSEEELRQQRLNLQ